MSRPKKRAVANRDTPKASAASVRPSRWFAFLRRASISLSAGALAYAFSFLRELPARANQWDFSHYYVSALAMRQGIDPYITDLTPLATSLGLEINEINHATYPPTFVLCFEPLTFLSPLHAYWLWIGMNILFLAAALYLLFDRFPKDTDLRLALIGLAILYVPVSDNFYYAQTQILILLLLTLFMRWMESGHDALAGSVLAVAGLLKLFPLILVGYLLVRRQRRALFFAGMTLLIGSVLTLGFVGLDRSLHFLGVLPFLTSPYWLGRPVNVALGAIISRLFWYSVGYFDPGVEFIRSAAALLAQLALLALTVRATLASSKLPSDRDEPVIALWVVTAILLSPTAWLHYLVLLFIPYAVLLRQRLHEQASARATLLGLTSYLVAALLLIVYTAVNILGEPSVRAWPALAKWTVENAWSGCVLLVYAATYSLVVATTIPPVRTAAGRAPRRPDARPVLAG